MKNKIIITTLLSLFTILFFSCDNYLDTMPDSRAEVNSNDKVTSILVSAYPTNSSILIAEMASDNAMDNGAAFSPYNQGQEDAYLWKDMTTTGNDDPKAVWDGHYGAIAAANQALEAIKELGSPASLNAQKGEALIARAYGHFVLANLFCLNYNPETAGTDMGLPYSETPETKVSIKYERGTMAELYEKINKDIEEGLPLINDDIYSVPKYHFNRNAAHAFAARFNLYYLKFDKAINYANIALGDNPASILKKWQGMWASPSNFLNRCDMYISSSDPGNFLITTAYSAAPYILGPYNTGHRYGNALQIIQRQSFHAPGPWGTDTRGNLYLATGMWGYEQKYALPKLGAYFEYTDKVAGIGYLHSVPVPFTAGETLLCRAEAKLLQSNFAEGVADINIWIRANTNKGLTFTQDSLVNFMKKQPYMPLEVKALKDHSIKKTINPRGFTVEAGVQENLIQFLLFIRRIETIQQGLRWEDIKRYGIEYAHNREGEEADVLLKEDPRRAVQLPQDVISAGLTPNPRNK